MCEITVIQKHSLFFVIWIYWNAYQSVNLWRRWWCDWMLVKNSSSIFPLIFYVATRKSVAARPARNDTILWNKLVDRSPLLWWNSMLTGRLQDLEKYWLVKCNTFSQRGALPMEIGVGLKPSKCLCLYISEQELISTVTQRNYLIKKYRDRLTSTHTYGNGYTNTHTHISRDTRHTGGHCQPFCFGNGVVVINRSQRGFPFSLFHAL